MLAVQIRVTRVGDYPPFATVLRCTFDVGGQTIRVDVETCEGAFGGGERPMGRRPRESGVHSAVRDVREDIGCESVRRSVVGNREWQVEGVQDLPSGRLAGLYEVTDGAVAMSLVFVYRSVVDRVVCPDT
jgi:hypothetical protein